MNRGTMVMLGLAAASLVGAISMRPAELPPSQFEDTGTELFPDFKDPTLATSLEVKEWNEKEAKLRRFAVEQKEGRWVIPSHHDYPADATEAMGQAAASFIGVKKDTYYGDKAEDHGQFGVLDPEGESGKGDERGKRFTIKDTSGTVLADLIVGKQIEGKENFYYVRFPTEKRVYGSRMEIKISANFGDWIEKDLLHVERDEIVTMIYDPYKVDENVGKVVDSEPIRVDLLDTADGSKQEWQLAGGKEVPKGKELDAAKFRQMVGSIDRLQIAGVRARPKPLTLPALQAHGFFVTPDGRRLFGNEGEIKAVTKDGVVYTLYFGEVTFDAGEALTAGKAPAEGEEAGETDGEDAGEKSKTASRFIFIDVGYDPEADKGGSADAPEGETEAAADEGKAEDDQPALEGQERADSLRKRFGTWFFVITDTSYKQIHKGREELFKDKKEEK